MPASIPSEGVQYNEYVTKRSDPLTRNQYLLRNVLVATLGEGLVQKFGCANSLSASETFNTITTTIDDFTGFKNWIPNVLAEEVEVESTPELPIEAPAAPETVEAAAPVEAAPVEAPAPVEVPAAPVEAPASNATWSDFVPNWFSSSESAPETTTNSSWNEYLPGWPSFLSNENAEAIETASTTASTWSDYVPGFISDNSGIVSRSWESISGYVSENGDWIALTGAVVLATSTANYMLRNKFKNSYQRNVVSTIAGSAAIWAGSMAVNYLGYSNPVEFKQAIDVGTRAMGYIAGLHYGRQAVNLAARTLEPVTDWVTKPYSYQTTKVKTA